MGLDPARIKERGGGIIGREGGLYYFIAPRPGAVGSPPKIFKGGGGSSRPVMVQPARPGLSWPWPGQDPGA